MLSAEIFNLIAIDQYDITSDELRKNITGIHVLAGVNDTNRAHGCSLLSHKRFGNKKDDAAGADQAGNDPSMIFAHASSSLIVIVCPYPNQN